MIKGTVVERVSGLGTPPSVIVFEHSMGSLDVGMRLREGRPVASLLRTARRLFEGRIIVPADIGKDRKPLAGAKGKTGMPVHI